MKYQDTKKWFESKTIWASIVTITAGVAGAIGYNVDVATQGAIINNITAGIAAIGGLFSLVGRLVAEQKIG